MKDREGKSRGYGFIEFETEADMKVAYKRADGRKIDGRRVTVDVERGRTVRGWLPRRLGGGLGTGRPAKLSKEQLMYAVWWCLDCVVLWLHGCPGADTPMCFVSSD